MQGYCSACGKDSFCPRAVVLCQNCFKNTKDDPETDGTDLAHPAYWRGQETGVVCTIRRIRKILDGKDNGRGVIGNEEFEKLRRDLLQILRSCI